MEGIFRDLGMSMSLLALASESIKGIDLKVEQQRVDSGIKCRIKRVLDFVVSDDSVWTYDNANFKELFAHSKCQVIFDSLFDVFVEHGFDAEGLLFVDESGNIAHYVLKVSIMLKHSVEYVYIDAYGFYSEIKAIESRYKDSVIVEHKRFIPYSDDEGFMDQYRDNFVNLFDEIESEAFESYGVSDISDVCDYNQLFLHKQTLLLFELLDDAFEKSQAE
jgi:hypothetical protein